MTIVLTEVLSQLLLPLPSSGLGHDHRFELVIEILEQLIIEVDIDGLRSILLPRSSQVDLIGQDNFPLDLLNILPILLGEVDLLGDFYWVVDSDGV